MPSHQHQWGDEPTPPPSLPPARLGPDAPPWSAVLLAEMQHSFAAVRREVAQLRVDVADQGQRLDELARVVVGGSEGKPSHDEQLRELRTRVGFLEGLVKWISGIGTAVIATAATAALAAWKR